MIVAGLDIATSTGFCLMDTAAKPAAWRYGAIQSEGENGEDKAEDLVICLYGLIRETRPDFAAIEMPQRSVTNFSKRGDEKDSEEAKQTINPNALQLSTLAGAVVGMLALCRIPWGLVAPASWRSSYFGKGVKPAGGDWKALAIEYAKRQAMPLPATIKAQRDAAEAVGIASAWHRCTFVPERHQKAFTDLRAGGARPK